jgi:hypothetical protein
MESLKEGETVGEYRGGNLFSVDVVEGERILGNPNGEIAAFAGLAV